MDSRRVGLGLVAIVVVVGAFMAGRSSVSRLEPPPAPAEGPAVVQTDPLAPSDELVAFFMSEDGECLPPENPAFGGLGLSAVNSTFALREPSDGSGSYGALISIASGSESDGCSITATFEVPQGIRFFEVVNEGAGTRWGPFDVSQVAESGWFLTLSS